MALSDVSVYDDGVFGAPNAKRFRVNAGGPAAINAGELVLIADVGNQSTAGAAGKMSYVTRWTVSNSAKPSVGTDFVAGLASSTSTETLSAKGVVDVFPNLPGMTYLGNPDVAATWNTQAKYDLLVGSQVLLACSSTGTQTVLATNGSRKPFTTGSSGSSGNGLIVEPLNIAVYPGKVRFSLKQSLDPRTV